MGEDLFQGKRRDKTEVARAKRRALSLVYGIGGAVLQIDLLIAEAQCIARLPVRPLKNFPLETESPFIELCGFFDVTDREDDVSESIRESFGCHGLPRLVLS